MPVEGTFSSPRASPLHQGEDQSVASPMAWRHPYNDLAEQGLLPGRRAGASFGPLWAPHRTLRGSVTAQRGARALRMSDIGTC